MECICQKKFCEKCSHQLQKRGKTAAGSQRYFCPYCHCSIVRSRPGRTRRNHFAIYLEWLSGKLSLTELGKKYSVNRSTLERWFSPFRASEITPDYVNCSDQVLIADGYYVRYMAQVLISQLPDDRPVSWLFTYTENYYTWLELFNQIRDTPLALVGDGQRGMIKAAKLRWPKIIIQRCQFHVIHQVNLLLTKQPETIPAQEFKGLVGTISTVKTKLDFKSWVLEFKLWYDRYADFLRERTFQDSLTPTGRHKWHYTHSRLHAAFSHVKNAFPNLFQYLRYPQIPNTSNRIEGSINASLQRLIDLHRGSTLIGQRQLIAAFLKSKQQKSD